MKTAEEFTEAVEKHNNTQIEFEGDDDWVLGDNEEKE